MKQAKILTETEIKRVKAIIKGNRYATRNMAMFVLGLNVGLRAKEIATLKVGDVLSVDGTIRSECVLTAEQTKRNEANRIFLNVVVQKQLKKYFDENEHLQANLNGCLFQSKNYKGFTPKTVGDLFARIFEIANIKEASSHSLRRTFATKLADNSTSVFAIQKLMRHKNISTTQLYVNVTDTQLLNATNNLNFG